MAASMTACQSGSKETAAETKAESAASEETKAETTEAETAAAEPAEKVTQTKPLVVYLNDFDAVIPDLFKEATGYEVEVVVGNGAETMSRIAAEKGNTQWDAVWIDSMYDVYALSQDGQLKTGWEPENAAGVLVCRNDVFSEADAPKSFAELTDEKYSGKVGMADPGVAAPAYPLAAYFMDELGLDGGKEYFQTLFDQGLKVYPKNPQVVQALASGEPISVLWPEDGAPGSTRVAAISADTKQPEIAEAFVNFLLDPETQQQLVNTGDEGYFEPSVEGVTRKAERDPQAKLAVTDVDFGSENEAEIKAWFADMSAQ